MRNIIVSILVSLIIFAPAVSAQLKIGYVDSDAILDQLQDAQDARQQLDQLIQEWQSDLNKQEREWKAKYDDYDKRKLIMSEQTRAEVEAELVKMEQKISEYREKKFGTNGELFQKQEELMKPVQNKVFTIIKKVSADQDLDFVFDRSGGTLMLYAKDKYDITGLVMKALNITPGTPSSQNAPAAQGNQNPQGNQNTQGTNPQGSTTNQNSQTNTNPNQPPKK
jgi:outer membrane protein